jgi:hypothetical protein
MVGFLLLMIDIQYGNTCRMSRKELHHSNRKVSQLCGFFDDALSVVVGGLSANELRGFTFCEQDFAV